MHGYSSGNIFTVDELELFADATALLLKTPEDEHLRCHELARAIAIHYADSPLKPYVVDGKFGLADHSWIQFRAGSTARGHIFEVYAVGAYPMVQLIDAWSLALRNARNYVEGEARNDVRTDVIDKLLVAWKQPQKRPSRSPL